MIVYFYSMKSSSHTNFPVEFFRKKNPDNSLYVPARCGNYTQWTALSCDSRKKIQKNSFSRVLVAVG